MNRKHLLYGVTRGQAGGKGRRKRRIRETPSYCCADKLRRWRGKKKEPRRANFPTPLSVISLRQSGEKGGKKGDKRPVLSICKSQKRGNVNSSRSHNSDAFRRRASQRKEGERKK